MTIDNADAARSDAEKEREEKAEGRAERFGGTPPRRPEFRGRLEVGHEISERSPSVSRSSSATTPRAAPAVITFGSTTPCGRASASATTPTLDGAGAGRREPRAVKKDPGRTLRRLDKLGADLRAVENGSAAGPPRVFPQSRRPWAGDPAPGADGGDRPLGAGHQDAEAEGVKMWSKADFSVGLRSLPRHLVRGPRVNPKAVTIPHIHNGAGSASSAPGNKPDG